MAVVPDNLTPELLRQLYVEEAMSEASIAKRFNTHQMKISRLRKEWGISTVLRSDRYNLPDMTLRLRSILVGSLLGEGCMRESASQTAGYVEHFSAQQPAYLEWKLNEWGPYGLPLVPAQNGVRFFTHMSRNLRPFLEMFYPNGKGRKTFTRLPLEWVDELALAVWFLGSGSLGETGVSLRGGSSPDDQKALVRALARLGVEAFAPLFIPKVRLCLRSSVDKFLSIVDPHIPPSLRYRLDYASSRKRITLLSTPTS